MRRRMLSMRNNLPYDYEIDYIQSDGNQYIYHDCAPFNKVEIEFQLTTSKSQQRIFCGSSWDRGFNIYESGAGISTSIQNDWSCSYWDKTTRYHIILNAITLTTTITNVSTSKTQTYSNTEYGTEGFNIGRGFYLFDSSDLNRRAIGKMYYCKLYYNDTIIVDMIPTRKGTVGYMYDKVSGELYGNNGSGNFTLGTDK